MVKYIAVSMVEYYLGSVRMLYCIFKLFYGRVDTTNLNIVLYSVTFYVYCHGRIEAAKFGISIWGKTLYLFTLSFTLSCFYYVLWSGYLMK